MSTKITIGSCNNVEDVWRAHYDYNAVVDRVYDIIHLLPEEDSPIGDIAYIVTWGHNGRPNTGVIWIKYKRASVDGQQAIPDFYAWWSFPIKWLFMSEQEIIDDYLRRKEDEAVAEIEEEKRIQREQEQKQYKEYLRLKAIYEPHTMEKHDVQKKP